MPFLSMVRMAAAETRSFTQRFSLATQKRRSCRLGRKRRRVLLLACETLLPLITRLRSEEHTSELQSLMRISYAVFCLKKKTNTTIKLQTQLTSKITSPIQTQHYDLKHVTHSTNSG